MLAGGEHVATQEQYRWNRRGEGLGGGPTMFNGLQLAHLGPVEEAGKSRYWGGVAFSKSAYSTTAKWETEAYEHSINHKP